uniref:Uncharacterized protein n=1 Tax=Macaca fascicularis TaxID=9541 RepID=A0A7N9I9A6_MACFA
MVVTIGIGVHAYTLTKLIYIFFWGVCQKNVRTYI